MGLSKQHKFNITESAFKRIKDLQDKKHFEKFLRIAVDSGGCSGFTYDFSFDNTLAESDFTIKDSDGIVIAAIDDLSMEFLSDSSLEFISDIGKESFKIVNPNSATSCGCGKSFSV